MDVVTIADGVAEAVIVPELGAGLASYDLILDGRRDPLFRPCGDLARAKPFDLANNLLVPWSGRISGGGFHFDGAFHALAPNFEGEPSPMHGNGLTSRWIVERTSASSVVLSLRSDGPGPFRYDAEVTYRLVSGALTVGLAVISRAPDALPYGLGLHPWLPRTPATTLRAKAERVTLEDSRHLPAAQLAVASRPEWDFSAPRRLPEAWINNDFSAWDGFAEVVWEDRGLALAIETSGDPHLTTYLLYSPGIDAGFFCFEPVTHPVDAHNRTASGAGLVRLRAGERLSVSCRFAPRLLGSLFRPEPSGSA